MYFIGFVSFSFLGVKSSNMFFCVSSAAGGGNVFEKGGASGVNARNTQSLELTKLRIRVQKGNQGPRYKKYCTRVFCDNSGSRFGISV